MRHFLEKYIAEVNPDTVQPQPFQNENLGKINPRSSSATLI